MIILKIIVLWVLSGLALHFIFEGIPNPREKLTRSRKRLMKFDIIAGPLGWLYAIFLTVKQKL